MRRAILTTRRSNERIIMYCMKCDQHLSRCTCPDLKEKLEKLAACTHVHIAPEVMAVYAAQAERNKERVVEE